MMLLASGQLKERVGSAAARVTAHMVSVRRESWKVTNSSGGKGFSRVRCCESDNGKIGGMRGEYRHPYREIPIEV